MPQFACKNTATIGSEQFISYVSSKSWKVTNYVIDFSNKNSASVPNIIFIIKVWINWIVLSRDFTLPISDKTSQPHRPCIHYSVANACKYEPMRTEIVLLIFTTTSGIATANQCSCWCNHRGDSRCNTFASSVPRATYDQRGQTARGGIARCKTTPAGLRCVQCVGGMCTPSRRSLNTPHSAVTLRVYTSTTLNAR